MAKLDEKAVALSMGLSAGVIYVICFVFVAILPLEMIITIDNMLLHSINASTIAIKSTTIAGALGGVALWFVLASGAGYVFAIIYNKLQKD